MKNIFVLVVILFFPIANAQVVITNGTTEDANINDQIILYINNINEASNVKGFGLPAVDTPENLPYTSPVPSTKIEALKGMLMFVKSTGEAMVFEGQYWSKAFNVEGDNISRFRINTASTTNGQASLTIDPTIDKAYYFADPLKLKTNVSQSERIYIRQSGVYRISIDLVFTTLDPSSISNRLGIKLLVNGGNRFDLLENYANYSGNTYMVSLDTSVYVRQGDYLSFTTVPDTSGTTDFTIIKSVTETRKDPITNENINVEIASSAITVEKIM